MSRETGSDQLNPRRKHGLGRGLGALLGRSPHQDEDESEEQADPASEGGIHEVPVDEIEPEIPTNRGRALSRRVWLSWRLRYVNMVSFSLLIVAERPDQPQRFWLIAGERRWRAARQAGLPVVPAVVREASSQQLLELALVENLQRDDLSPLEEAAAFTTLIDQFSLTQATGRLSGREEPVGGRQRSAPTWVCLSRSRQR